MTSIVVTSDLHGSLPDIPPCDLLIVAGDVCPDHPIGKAERYDLPDNGSQYQLEFLDGPFRDWLINVPAKEVVGIAGNHDFVFERMPLAVDQLGLAWDYLLDSEVTRRGLRIWGTPWVPGLSRWAFHGDEDKLQQVADVIPEGIDILVTHGPPHGIADLVGPRFGGPANVGNVPLLSALDRVRPRVVVCGHIHEAYGVYKLPHGGDLYSVSLNDDAYCPDQPPVMIAA